MPLTGVNSNDSRKDCEIPPIGPSSPGACFGAPISISIDEDNKGEVVANSQTPAKLGGQLADNDITSPQQLCIDGDVRQCFPIDQYLFKIILIITMLFKSTCGTWAGSMCGMSPTGFTFSDDPIMMSKSAVLASSPRCAMVA